MFILMQFNGVLFYIFLPLDCLLWAHILEFCLRSQTTNMLGTLPRSVLQHHYWSYHDPLLGVGLPMSV